MAKYLARRRGTATALPVNGEGAGPALVVIASPSPSAGAPETDTATAAEGKPEPAAGEVPAVVVPDVPPVGDSRADDPEPGPFAPFPDWPAVDVPPPAPIASAPETAPASPPGDPPARFVAARSPALLLAGVTYEPGAEVPAKLCSPALVKCGYVVREQIAEQAVT